ncbi:MAG: DUF3108 domain-containing protein, partial [Magnetococcus sp. DMHC-8]
KVLWGSAPHPAGKGPAPSQTHPVNFYLSILSRLKWGALVWTLVLPGVGTGVAEEWRLGAAPGEHLQYTIRWLGAPAATAAMQVESGPGDTYTVQTTFATMGATRLIRAIDDSLTAEGRYQEAGFMAQRFVKDQRRGEQIRWTRYHFDREMHQVQRLHRSQADRPEEATTIPFAMAQITDPLSALYAVRAWSDLLPDQTLARWVVDGEKVFCLTMTVGGGRLLQTPLGTFPVFSLQVVVENAEKRRYKGPIQLWLTDDHRRIPVQVEAQLSIGTVVAELTAYEDGRGNSRSVQEH